MEITRLIFFSITFSPAWAFIYWELCKFDLIGWENYFNITFSLLFCSIVAAIFMVTWQGICFDKSLDDQILCCEISLKINRLYFLRTTDGTQKKAPFFILSNMFNFLKGKLKNGKIFFYTVRNDFILSIMREKKQWKKAL